MGVTIDGSVSQEQYTYPAPGARIEWLQPERMGAGIALLHSACRRYRIDKCASKNETTYTVWAKVPGPLHRRLGCEHSADAAKALAQRDADLQVRA